MVIQETVIKIYDPKTKSFKAKRLIGFLESEAPPAIGIKIRDKIIPFKDHDRLETECLIEFWEKAGKPERGIPGGVSREELTQCVYQRYIKERK